MLQIARCAVLHKPCIIRNPICDGVTICIVGLKSLGCWMNNRETTLMNDNYWHYSRLLVSGIQLFILSADYYESCNAMKLKLPNAPSGEYDLKTKNGSLARVRIICCTTRYRCWNWTSCVNKITNDDYNNDDNYDDDDNHDDNDDVVENDDNDGDNDDDGDISRAWIFFLSLNIFLSLKYIFCRCIVRWDCMEVDTHSCIPRIWPGSPMPRFNTCSRSRQHSWWEFAKQTDLNLTPSSFNSRNIPPLLWWSDSITTLTIMIHRTRPVYRTLTCTSDFCPRTSQIVPTLSKA